MSRILNRPVQMTTGPGGRPHVFLHAGARYHVVEVLESWEEAGRWWEQEPPQTGWRVRLRSGGVVELLRLHTDPPQWIWYKSYD